MHTGIRNLEVAKFEHNIQKSTKASKEKNFQHQKDGNKAENANLLKTG